MNWWRFSKQKIRFINFILSRKKLTGGEKIISINTAIWPRKGKMQELEEDQGSRETWELRALGGGKWGEGQEARWLQSCCSLRILRFGHTSLSALALLLKKIFARLAPHCTFVVLNYYACSLKCEPWYQSSSLYAEMKKKQYYIHHSWHFLVACHALGSSAF
mgnify:CR=1 FL=1